MPRFVACKLLQNIRQTAFYLLSGLQSGLATLHSHFAKSRRFKSLISNYEFEIRQSKINSRLVAGPIGQTNRRPSV